MISNKNDQRADRIQTRKDGNTMTRHRSHSKKWWNNGFPTNRKGKNMNLRKYLPLIGCWVVVLLLMGWFVSNDLVLVKQAVEHQC